MPDSMVIVDRGYGYCNTFMNVAVNLLFATKYPKRSPAIPKDFDKVRTTIKLSQDFVMLTRE